MNTSDKKTTKKKTSTSDGADLRVAAYEKQFLALEGKVYKLEAENARLRARIKVLEEAKPDAVIRTMTDDELSAQIEPLIKSLGYVKKSD